MEVWLTEKTYTAIAVQAIVGATGPVTRPDPVGVRTKRST